MKVVETWPPMLVGKANVRRFVVMFNIYFVEDLWHCPYSISEVLILLVLVWMVVVPVATNILFISYANRFILVAGCFHNSSIIRYIAVNHSPHPPNQSWQPNTLYTTNQIIFLLMPAIPVTAQHCAISITDVWTKMCGVVSKTSTPWATALQTWTSLQLSQYWLYTELSWTD